MNEEERLVFNARIEEKWANERKKWRSQLVPLYDGLSKDPTHLADIQSLMLKYRHDLTEEISMLLGDIAKQSKYLKEKKKERMENYMSGGSQVRFKTKGEMDIAISGDIALAEQTVELLDIHMEFLRECRISMDKLGYSVTNRLEIFKLITQ